jgi:hypothetical protein
MVVVFQLRICDICYPRSTVEGTFLFLILVSGRLLSLVAAFFLGCGERQGGGQWRFRQSYLKHPIFEKKRIL